MIKEYDTVTLPKLMRLLALRLKDGKNWLVGDKVRLYSHYNSFEESYEIARSPMFAYCVCIRYTT